jgi:hypothetical protein
MMSEVLSDQLVLATTNVNHEDFNGQYGKFFRPIEMFPVLEDKK